MLNTAIALIWTLVLAQDVALPPAVFVGAADIDAVVTSSTASNRLDSKITETAIPGGIVRMNIIYRRDLEQAPLVHEQLTEIYQIISGTGTVKTGGTLTNRTPVSDPTNLGTAPSWGGVQVGGVERRLQPKDVLIVPAGTPHKFVHLDGPITYVIYRIDAPPK
jgi:mannose-6-phosphate isomerase-like protein (cupin superfamily)